MKTKYFFDELDEQVKIIIKQVIKEERESFIKILEKADYGSYLVTDEPVYFDQHYFIKVEIKPKLGLK